MDIKIYPIKDHDGYGVDKEGNVYSYWVNKAKHGVHKTDIPKKMVGCKGKNGHITVIFRGHIQKYVHRIVFETFMGEIPKNMVVRHLNDIPSDNRLENLEIGTQKENIQDCARNGNLIVGKDRWNSLFKDEDIRKIRSLKGKLSGRKIAQMYNCHPGTIGYILRGDTWKHVQ